MNSFKNILVVVTYNNDSHILIFFNQGLNKSELVLIHILSFINDQDLFGYLAMFNLSILDFSDCHFNSRSCLIQIPHGAK